MKALAKTMVLVLLLAVTASSAYIAATAAEDVDTEIDAAEADVGFDDFALDDEMIQYSAGATTGGSTYYSDDVGTYIGNIENSPSIRIGSDLAGTISAAGEDDEIDDEAEIYNEDIAPINDQPDTGRAEVAVPVAVAVALLAAVPVLNKKN